MRVGSRCLEVGTPLPLLEMLQEGIAVPPAVRGPGTVREAVLVLEGLPRQHAAIGEGDAPIARVPLALVADARAGDLFARVQPKKLGRRAGRLSGDVDQPGGGLGELGPRVLKSRSTHAA